MPSVSYMIISLLFFICILTVQGNYFAYTYDADGSGDDEHCCLIRKDDKFCLAKPLTRSLLQANKQCQQLNGKEKNKNYLNKILKRLNVETSYKVGDKILVELQKSLDNDILNNDILCLSPNNNNIDLENCHVIVPVIKKKKTKKQSKNETVVQEEEAPEDTTPFRQVDVAEPIAVRRGEGLSVRETYQLDLADLEISTNKERQCWSWYRQHTKNILNYPTKSKKTCISLNKQGQECLNELFNKQSSDNQQELNSIRTGSTLYCQNTNKQSKLLGYYLNSEICFSTHYQIYIDHKFTDFVSLSDKNKNRPVLKFITNSTKLTHEFENDCNDKKTLNDIKKLIEIETKTNTAPDEPTPTEA